MVVIALIWESVVTEPAFLWMGWYGAVYSFAPGLLPALLAGLASAWLSQRIARSWMWIAAAAAIAGIGAAAGALIGGYQPAGHSPAGFTGLALACGVAVGALCAALCMGFRPRAASRPSGSA